MENKSTWHGSGHVIPLATTELMPSHRILVADDDESVRLLVVRELRDSGYHVDSAENGAIAWDMLQVGDYDLLVTDHHMPHVSGIELVGKLRSAQRALSVILISGLMPIADLKRQPWLGLAAALEKPFTGDELTAAVGNALQALQTSSSPDVSRPLMHRGITQSRAARPQA